MSEQAIRNSVQATSGYMPRWPGHATMLAELELIQMIEYGLVYILDTPGTIWFKGLLKAGVTDDTINAVNKTEMNRRLLFTLHTV